MKDKDTRLSIRFSDEELEHIKKHSSTLGVSLSDFVREILFRETGYANNGVQYVSLAQRIDQLETRLKKVEQTQAA